MAHTLTLQPPLSFYFILFFSGSVEGGSMPVTCLSKIQRAACRLQPQPAPCAPCRRRSPAQEPEGRDRQNLPQYISARLIHLRFIRVGVWLQPCLHSGLNKRKTPAYCVPKYLISEPSGVCLPVSVCYLYRRLSSMLEHNQVPVNSPLGSRNLCLDLGWISPSACAAAATILLYEVASG